MRKLYCSNIIKHISRLLPIYCPFNCSSTTTNIKSCFKSSSLSQTHSQPATIIPRPLINTIPSASCCSVFLSNIYHLPSHNISPQIIDVVVVTFFFRFQIFAPFLCSLLLNYCYCNISTTHNNNCFNSSSSLSSIHLDATFSHSPTHISFLLLQLY